MSVEKNSMNIQLDMNHTAVYNWSAPVTEGATETKVPRYPGLYDFSVVYSGYHGYISAIVCVFGIVSNMANIVVLTRKNMVSSTNLILTWLAVADLLTMTTYLPVSIHFYILRLQEVQFPASKDIHWIRFLLFHANSSVTCHTVAIWLTIVLALFRYLYICYPTKCTQLCSLQRAKIAILCIYIFTILVCVPNYLMYQIKTSFYAGSNIVVEPFNKTTNNTEYISNPDNGSFYYFDLDDSFIIRKIPKLKKANYWIHAFLIKLLPCTLLTVLTILLIIAMHKANQRRMKLKSQGRKAESDRARETNRTTIMLLCVVGLFLLTELPQGILTLCNIFVVGFYYDVYEALGDLLDITALLNNSINFVLYCTMSRQFRQTFASIFCSCCPKTRPGWLKLKTFNSKANNVTHV